MTIWRLSRRTSGRLRAARRERIASARRLEQARTNVIEPLARLTAENQFAEIIKAGIAAGYGGRDR